MSVTRKRNRDRQPGKSGSKDTRIICVRVIQHMLRDNGTLTSLLPEAMTEVADTDQARLQAWCYGMCRWAHQLQALVDSLLDKPLRDKDLDVYLLLQLGIYQLRFTRIQAHAAVDETVKCVRHLGKNWARGLVNAVLRRYQREVHELEHTLTIDQQLSFPGWLLSQVRADWPDRWHEICAASNQQGPMTLRVNQSRLTRDAYARQLSHLGMDTKVLKAAPDALILDLPVAVAALPGFSDGLVSVQDGAAQLALAIIQRHATRDSLRMLDACAAPGGKTAHAAESNDFASILALDNNASRIQRVTETVQRLGLGNTVTVVNADARCLEEWWDGEAFDVVLLDAPCSGTGVIRRHPDIKLLRQPTDIAALVKLQRELLDSLWPTVAPGGMLLYITCSILQAENQEQIRSFAARTPDAMLLESPRQLFPGEDTMDGFFYAPLRKRS